MHPQSHTYFLTPALFPTPHLSPNQMSLFARRLATSLAPRSVSALAPRVSLAVAPVVCAAAPFSTAAASSSGAAQEETKFFRKKEVEVKVEEVKVQIPFRTRYFTIRDAVYPTKANGYNAKREVRYAHVHHELLAMLDVTGPLTRLEMMNRMCETGYSRNFVKDAINTLRDEKRVRHRVLLHPRTKQPSFFFYTTPQSQRKYAREIQKESYLRRYQPAGVLERVAEQRATVEAVVAEAKRQAEERAAALAEEQRRRDEEALARRG